MSFLTRQHSAHANLYHSQFNVPPQQLRRWRRAYLI